MNYKIAVIGLGYVGLPLARLFSTKYKTIGFDLSKTRVEELQNGIDVSMELSTEQLKEALKNGLECTSEVEDIKTCNVYIVAVPTPITKYNVPDLSPLISASELIGSILLKGDIVVYESTVYPGATEEDCVPILEKVSRLRYNKDFFVGYSPERINPGDRERTVEKVKKVTSGSTLEIAKIVDKLYSSVITAGTHMASSIKVAEASKVIENTQRDINIAFINELAKIFKSMKIDTTEVLEAAATKWNFIKFQPGLVGGHCIGVDPYYLAQKAQEFGHHPEIILAGRRINDGMGSYIAGQVVKCMIRKDILVRNSRVLILGLSFKENCPDIRNTKVVDLVQTLDEYGINVDVHDPWVDPKAAKREYGIKILKRITKKYDAIVLAVAHPEYKDLNVREYIHERGVVYDIKSFLPRVFVDERL
ncbi:nucleotide sugar dehydrogenase [Odoribacter sp. OttesenSCG-928-A06]|nr:nucleotide sugar dehydrogenase [Odoribacter sp. OttesenSCG-928-A06]